MNRPPKVTLIIVMGPSGCGKTTIAKSIADHYAIAFIEGDQLHPADNIAKMAAGTPLTDDDRWPWLDQIRQQCSIFALELKAKPSATKAMLVITCSALKRSYRDFLRQVTNIDRLVFIFPRLDYQTTLRRMKHRAGHYMKASMLDSQFQTLEQPDMTIESDVLIVDGDEPIEQILKRLKSFVGRIQ